jgi:arylsulfatase A-like enzyme/Tfp pilus assembly protein PilF
MSKRKGSRAGSRRRAAAPVVARPRRNWRTLALAGVVVAVGLGLGTWQWLRGPAFRLLPPDSGQDILLVTIDTLRADALSSYGGPAQTPNLDALAAHGARFTFAHAHAVVTLVSHTTILTGLLPYQHGIRDNGGYRLRPGTATVATRLKALGFATGAFVGGFPLTKRFGLTPGFDVYDDQIPEMRGVVDFALPERRADVVVSRALDWIGRQDGRFFAWVHVFDPHSPYRPPEPYLSEYREQPYYGEVAWTDHALGPLFARLKTLSRPTLVIVTADHGESLGEHGELTHGMFAYEATLHIPLIIAEVRPGVTRQPRGEVIDTPVRHIDILPTILDCAGAPPDTALPGSSLRDVIRNGGGGARPEYFESMTFNLTRGWAPLRGVLVGKQKYIDLPIRELYNLVKDPKEQDNLAPAQPAEVQVMDNTLRTYNVAPPDRPGQVTAEVKASLQALGYVSGSAPRRATYTEADDPKRLVSVDTDLHRAIQLYETGDVQAAVDLFKSVIARRPDMADASIYLAYVYWDAGQIGDAIATLEAAVKAGVGERDVRTRLGIYLAESKRDTKRAIALLEQSPTDDVEALNGLGVAYTDAGRSADALQTFRRILALDPTNGLAYQNIAVIQLRAALAIHDPKDPRRVAGIREAEKSVRAALSADPSLSDAYTTYGVILADTDRRSEAIDSWKRAVQLDPTDFDALENLTDELLNAGRIDDARRYGEQFLKNAPAALYQADINRIRTRLAGG